MAVLEAANNELKCAFSLLYHITTAFALIYMVGWVYLNILEVSNGLISLGKPIAGVLTALAGIAHAAMLPAVLVALGVEHLLQRRINQSKLAIADPKDQSLPCLTLLAFSYPSSGYKMREAHLNESAESPTWHFVGTRKPMHKRPKQRNASLHDDQQEPP